MPATPPPAPEPAPVVVEQVPEPVQPEPVVVEAAPPPLDLATVARTPALWPKQVALVQAVVFPVILNGRPSGSATVPAGTGLRLHRVAGQHVDVEYQNARQFIPATATDLMARATAADFAAKQSASVATTAPSPLPALAAPPVTEPAASKATGKIPELRVQVSVGTSQRRSNAVGYIKYQTIRPKCVIAGASNMIGIPAMEATMLVITMATKEKYVAGTESYFVQTTETLEVEPAANGASRTYQFEESEVSYDAWRDGTNVGGRVYKYFVFGLTDPATKELVHFQTNCPALATHAKENPGKRAGILKLKKDAKFPAKF